MKMKPTGWTFHSRDAEKATRLLPKGITTRCLASDAQAARYQITILDTP